MQMRQIRKDQAEYRSTCPEVLNEDQYSGLKDAFFVYAEENGWYKDFDKSVELGGKYFWDWQQDIIDDVLRSVFQKKGYTIGLSVKRQEGKTEIMALVLVFCYENYFITFGEPFGVGIVGPGKMMSSTVFKRLNNYLLTQSSELAIDQSEYKESLRGDSLASFSISETGGTTIEGKTLNFILRDESHKGSDRRWRDEVLWTTAAVEGATIALLGCAGYTKCDFMTMLGNGNIDEQKVYIVEYERLKPYMEALGKRGLRRAQGWAKRTEKLVRQNGGWNSPETRKNVFCEWQCELGSYLTEEQILACTKEIPPFNPDSGIEELVAFIDMGHSGDRSIATIMNMRSEIIDIIMLKKERETAALRDQLEYFFSYCDKKEYTPYFQSIGIDQTGLGIGAHEILQEMSPCATYPIVFSLQSKFEMFTTFKNHVITEWKEDRVTFPEGHKYMPLLIEEFTELDQEVSELGLLKFHAPEHSGTKKYDDICDSVTACLKVLFHFREQFQKMTPYKKRHNREKIFKKRLEKNRTKRELLKAIGFPEHKKKQKSILSQTVGSW